MTSDLPILYCSFCGKSHHEVCKLIAGYHVYICNECVELCYEIIKFNGVEIEGDLSAKEGD